MEKRIFKSKRLNLEVTRNADGSMNVIDTDGRPYVNAGALICSFGGRDNFWANCRTQEEWDKIADEVAIFEAQRKIRRENQRKEEERKNIAEREVIEAEYKNMIANGRIESNYQNIYTLLRYLQLHNWGGWELPAMSVGYSCNQYDCDGKTAVTIKLDKKINIPSTDESSDKFVYGNPRGHLEKYTRIIDPKYL